MLLHDFLRFSAERFPDKTMVKWGTKTVSYEQLWLAAQGFATTLIEQGLGREDRVAVYLENSIESIVAIYGTLLAGGSFVVVNPQVKSEKLLYLVKDCSIRYLVSAPRNVQKLSPHFWTMAHLTTLFLQAMSFFHKNDPK